MVFDYSDIVTQNALKTAEKAGSLRYQPSDLPIIFKAPTSQSLSTQAKEPSYKMTAKEQSMFAKYIQQKFAE